MRFHGFLKEGQEACAVLARPALAEHSTGS
jgi:hypothetical protein